MDDQCKIQLSLEFGHRAQLRQRETSENFTHDWTVFLRGPQDGEIECLIEKVVFNLHDSYPKPKRVFKEPPYEVSSSGSADFLMPIKIHFRDKVKPKAVCFKYKLSLNIEDERLHSETLTFRKPSEEFRRKLIKAGGVVLVPETESGSGPDSSMPQIKQIKTEGRSKEGRSSSS